MKSNEIGISLSFFGGYEPGFGPDAHLPLMAANGLSTAEVWPTLIPPRNRMAFLEPLRCSFEDAGLRVNSVHTPFGVPLDISSPDRAVRAQGLSEALRCLDGVRLLGGRYLIVHPSSEPIEDAERSARIAQCQESLRVLGDAVDPD